MKARQGGWIEKTEKNIIGPQFPRRCREKVARKRAAYIDVREGHTLHHKPEKESSVSFVNSINESETGERQSRLTSFSKAWRYSSVYG